ncbi:hypothetical protein [Dactylosporangium darangshiense]|uniref:hypothetical protein n=1 Tax=Dactylosporangium darangshiense TaxID=579108 RepID=UPI003637F0EB
MTVDRTRAERLGDFLTAWVDRLPPRLRRFLPRSWSASRCSARSPSPSTWGS